MAKNKNNNGGQLNLPSVNFTDPVISESEKLLKTLVDQLDAEMYTGNKSIPSVTISKLINNLNAYEKKVFLLKLTAEDIEKLRHLANHNNFLDVDDNVNLLNRKNDLIKKWGIAPLPDVILRRVDICIEAIAKQTPQPSWLAPFKKAINESLERKTQIGLKIMSLYGNDALAYIKTFEYSIDATNKFDETTFKRNLET